MIIFFTVLSSKCNHFTVVCLTSRPSGSLHDHLTEVVLLSSVFLHDRLTAVVLLSYVFLQDRQVHCTIIWPKLLYYRLSFFPIVRLTTRSSDWSYSTIVLLIAQLSIFILPLRLVCCFVRRLSLWLSGRGVHSMNGRDSCSTLYAWTLRLLSSLTRHFE